MPTSRSAVSASTEFPAPAKALSVFAACTQHRQFPEGDTLDSSELPEEFNSYFQ
jgi:hypothetical protein